MAYVRKNQDVCSFLPHKVLLLKDAMGSSRKCHESSLELMHQFSKFVLSKMLIGYGFEDVPRIG